MDGDFFASEVVTVAATATTLTSATYAPSTGQMATMAFITVEGGPIRWFASGSTPTASSGHMARNGDMLLIQSTQDVVNFKAILATAVACNLRVSYKRGSESSGEVVCFPGPALSLQRHVIEEQPFGKGLLTQSGDQFTTAYTTTGDGYEAAATAVIGPANIAGSIVELMAGVTVLVKSSGTAENVLLKLQARNTGSTDWVTISDVLTATAPGTTYYPMYISGWLGALSAFTSVPFDIGVFVQSSGAGGENAVAKVKSSSYIKVTFDET